MGIKKRAPEHNEKLDPKIFWKKKYTDYYGEKPPFKLDEYKGLGRAHFLAEIFVYILFAIFIAWGVWNLVKIGQFIQSNYGDDLVNAAEIYEPYLDAAKTYTQGIVLAIILVFFISVGLNYLVVRIFSRLAVFIMYFTIIVQIGLFGYLYWKIDWDYNWVFLIPLGINILFLTVWAEKFKRAVKFLRRSCQAVVKEKKLLIPYITPTLLIMMLSMFYFAMIIGYYFDITQFNDLTYSFGSRSVTASEKTVFAAVTLLFVFLTYLVFNVTKAMKIFMIHAWYRADDWVDEEDNIWATREPDVTATGAELIPNSDFSTGVGHWSLYAENGAQARIARDAEQFVSPPSGCRTRRAARSWRW